MFASKHIFLRRLIVLVAPLMASFAVPAAAQEQEIVILSELFNDSAIVHRTEVSLVTCEPFNKIYSLYGHTGLRIYTPEAGIDLLANWGIFNMKQKFFALRFTLGLTDYSMDIESWDYFCYRYDHYGCGIYEQVLNLSDEEKQQLIHAVLENYKEENRTYRYNYFYDNCTTRVRDIIEASIDGEIVYPPHEQEQSFRELVHEWNDTHRWARWGNDFLLGFQADRIATPHQAQFLPFNLSNDFARAEIIDNRGEEQLVSASRWVLPPVYDKGALSPIDEYILSPIGVAMAYVIIFVVVVMIERRYHKKLWLFDAIMLTVTGILGLLLFIMIFSQHPTVRLNAQILVFNPLSLAFLYPIVHALRQGRHSPYETVLAVMTGIGLVLGMTIQHFAEGVMTLALFLLFTYIRHIGSATNEKN